MTLPNCHVSVPEYRPYGPHIYPLPEPERAGKDAQHVSRELLRVTDEIIAAKKDEVRILDDALVEAWAVIRELRQSIDAKDERYVALEEYAAGMTRAARRCV